MRPTPRRAPAVLPLALPLALSVALSAALAGCGDGGGGAPTPAGPAGPDGAVPAALSDAAAQASTPDVSGPDAGAPMQPAGGATTRKPGVASGLVTSEAGRPLAGAEISILGTTLAGHRTSFYPRTDGSGGYALTVPDGVYSISAQYDFTWNGKTYRTQLAPTDGMDRPSLPSKDGIVTSFVWKLKGLRPGARSTDTAFSYFGGEVKAGIGDVKSESFQTRIFATEFPQGFTAEVTLTPEGALADGSEGSVVTFKKEVKSQYDTDFGAMDVPLGRYRVTARATKPSGETRALQIVGAGAVAGARTAPTESTTVDFQPETGATGGLRPLYLELVYGAPYPGL